MIRLATALVLAGLGHPMHTSVTVLRYDASARAAQIAIRVYADDLAEAVPGANLPAADSALARYARERFSLADRRGRAVSLSWVGADRRGDAVTLRLSAPLPGGLRGARVGSTLLHERFRDQVNVVRAAEGARTVTLLFMRGDAPKAVP